MPCCYVLILFCHGLFLFDTFCLLLVDIVIIVHLSHCQGAAIVGLRGKVLVAGGHRGGFCEKNPEAAPC